MRSSIFLFFLIFLIAPSKTSAQYEIMFSNNYPPYNYTSQDGELIGFNIDIINAINDIYGLEIDISGDTWTIINQTLENKNIQAIGGAHYPGVPDNNYLYTRSTINTSHCFLYNTKYYSTFSIEILRSAQEPLVAMWENDVLVHYVLSINPNTKFLYVDNYDQLIQTLDREDVTCIFSQRVGSMYYAEKLNRNYIAPLEHRILERSMGFKVSKDNPKLAETINNGLEIILANGEYQRIYDKWISKYNEENNFWNKYLKYILFWGALILTLFLVLVIINWVLQTKVKSKTKDLQQQLELNSKITVELEKQKIKAEESDKMKSAFLANMSHEIRTPMNGILGFTDLLKSMDYSPEEQSQFIGIIQKSGNRMLGTINNIIDVSKLESGMESPQLKEVNIKEMMKELLTFFKPEANSKGLKLIINENSTTTSQPFFTDEYKLNSILTNLIKNALKFTKEGLVEISYSIKNKGSEFYVKDTGIGIAKDKQASIFDHFVQANFSHSSGIEGSGLGLSISKGYIELMNGEIQLESELNKGTTFYVRIPNLISEKNNKKAKIKKPVNKPEISKKYTIIIAEDDEISFEFLKQALRSVSKSILRAKDGQEVIELTRSNSDIDIILMDVKMPKINGLEATEEIRSFNEKVFIIAQTAYAQEGYKAKVIQAGCNAYLSKPIHKETLLEVISKA